MRTITLTSGDRFEVDSFTVGYITAALWSTSDESDDAGGEPLDRNYSIADLAPETMRAVIEDCRKFQEANAADLDRARSAECNGHDFWLTRNGHGTGLLRKQIIRKERTS